MNKTISDARFLQQIEDGSLPPEYFDHAGHLRLAWLLVESEPMDFAVSKASELIARYATSLGASDKYHATVTEFLIRLVSSRQTQAYCSSWQTFLARNSDLNLDCLQVLSQYYDKDVLFSAAAKRAFIAPNLKSLGV